MRSMTGFGAGSAEGPRGRVTVEIRGVNHRFLDVQVRVPREMASVEPKIRDRVRSKLERGRVEVSVWLRAPSDPLAGALAPARFRVLHEALQTLAGELGVPADLSLAELLALRELAPRDEGPVDAQGAWGLVRPPLDEALGELVAMRTREGEALVRDALALVESIERRASKLEAKAPAVVEQEARKLRARIRELAAGVDVDPARLAQEVAVLADRSDVREEITRLHAHVGEARRLLARRTGGRKLDFLAQEFHREANTLSVKLTGRGVAREAVALKADVEKLREQVQNLE